MIDIVVMFCDDKDIEWKKLKDYYLEKEGTKDRQVVGEERYRDWEAFKYWFRGVENNCDWFNKIFLVVANEKQIPKWLDIKNPKLRIVYHDEFIPKKLLPTFNASTIDLYLSNIEDLSDVYVFCNDDYYFINHVPINYFYRNGTLVYGTTEQPFRYFSEELEKSSSGTFYKIINNCLKFQKEIVGGVCKLYPFSHLPTVRNKNFEHNILNIYSDLFLQAQEKSKFRDRHNYTFYVFDCLYRSLNRYIQDDIYSNSYYVTLKSTVDFNKYIDSDMVCFNDTEQMDDFELTKSKLITFFEHKFPNKSSFEV